MIWFQILLFLSFISGQILSVELIKGVRILPLDIVTGLFSGYLLINQRNKRCLNYYLRTLFPFFFVAFMSLLWQIGRLDPIKLGISSMYLVRFIAYTGLIQFGGLVVVDRRRIHQSLWMAGVIVAGLGIIQYFLYPNLRNLAYLGWDPHLFRVFSTFLDPNFTGIILVLTLIISAYLLKTGSQRQLIVWLGSLITGLALLLTYSRGSFLALALAIFIFYLKTRQVQRLIIAMIAILVLISLLPRPGGEGVNMLRSLTVISRLNNNREAWDLFWQSPLVGHGFNTLRYVRVGNDFVTELDSNSAAGFHNSWLFILATSGLLGIVAYGWLWRQLLIIPKMSEQLTEATNYSVLAVFIHSQFDNSLFYPQVLFWLMLFIGSSVAFTGSK